MYEALKVYYSIMDFPCVPTWDSGILPDFTRFWVGSWKTESKNQLPMPDHPKFPTFPTRAN